MKAAPLALCLVWAAQADADVTAPQSVAPRTWRDACVVRLDAAATKLGLQARARASVIPLRNESGATQPVRYVEYATPWFSATVGDEAEAHADSAWTRSGGRVIENLFGEEVVQPIESFRRLHRRFAKLEGSLSAATEREFRRALDECLNMGDSK